MFDESTSPIKVTRLSNFSIFLILNSENIVATTVILLYPHIESLYAYRVGHITRKKPPVWIIM